MLEHFRQDLHSLFNYWSYASFELCEALANDGGKASSVTALSLSLLFQRQYPAITKVISGLLEEKEAAKIGEKREEGEEWEDKFLKMLGDYLPEPFFEDIHLLASDVTPIDRRYSECLEDRTYVHEANQVAGNKPVTVGYDLSMLAILCREKGWVAPLSLKRVPSEQKGTEVGLAQLQQILGQSGLDWQGKLRVHLGDTAYSAVRFIGGAYEEEDLVNIARLRSNRNLYYPFVEREPPRASKPGPKKRYGEKFTLNDPETWGPPDATDEWSIITAKGKERWVEVEMWEDLLMRGKRDLPMYDKPMRVVRIRLFDKKGGKPLFKRSLWLAVSGKRRKEVKLRQVQQAYGKRFDLEHFFRFGKQKLLLDAFQSPDKDQQENWWRFVQMAYWLLYMARDMTQKIPMPWERYLPAFKSPDQTSSQQGVPDSVSPTMVQRDYYRIIQGFEPITKPPKPLNNGKGRKKGQKMKPRTKHPVIKKSKTRSDSGKKKKKKAKT